MQKIFSGDDRARELGYKSYREFVAGIAKRLNLQFDPRISEDAPPLRAVVRDGRWLAECECGEFYYVSPSDPIGFCHGKCGNAFIGGLTRRIIFPDDREEIEQALLERELNGPQTAFDRLGTQYAGVIHKFEPIGAPRNWDGESVKEMREEHKRIKEIKEEIRRVEKEDAEKVREHGSKRMADGRE